MPDRSRWMIAVLVGLVAGSTALANKPMPPISYRKITVPGGKYVFVMIAPVPADREMRSWVGETAAEIREIRRVYSCSGLYRNDGSTEPLWTVDWYAHGVDVCSDGIHLVRHGPWAEGLLSSSNRPAQAPLESAFDQEAMSFFANGRLLRTYSIGELVDDPNRLPRSVSHFQWMDRGQIDNARSEYVLLTLDGNRFVFDLRTGGIISESRMGRVNRRLSLVSWMVVAAVALAGLAWIFWRIRARPPLERESLPKSPCNEAHGQ